MLAVIALVHAFLLDVADLWSLNAPPSPGAMAVLVVVAIGVTLALMAVHGWRFRSIADGGPPLGGAVRDRYARAALVVVRAPDTPGKPRPQAPGMALAAV